MQALSGVKLQVEPDTGICSTEQITGELSKCSGDNKECKYRFYACKTFTYCMHPDHKKFLAVFN